ncbi:c-type cytochrome [Methylophaga sp. OBS4]|uniref:c-type cytochrome n=1 Tax=Methylophaga sp. OBS4 TaxID=2991935 RepID=UPI002253E37F|nr:cytochrome c5 family protein [Methylophaga sp. OBS4]MCX4186684.1 cytochrome c5 family protein [Methylophaga sp. OBS4]
MNKNTSGKFFVGSIIAIVALFGLVLIILNNMQSLGKNAVEPESMDAEAVAERIKPVAEVNVGEPPVVEAPAAEETEVASSGGRGEQIVNQVCATCHGSGLMQSPKLGNASDWAPRIEKGIETLYNNAINGFNMMPAKGGRADLSDDEVKAAVDYMIETAQ